MFHNTACHVIAIYGVDIGKYTKHRSITFLSSSCLVTIGTVKTIEYAEIDGARNDSHFSMFLRNNSYWDPAFFQKIEYCLFGLNIDTQGRFSKLVFLHQLFTPRT